MHCVGVEPWTLLVEVGDRARVDRPTVHELGGHATVAGLVVGNEAEGEGAVLPRRNGLAHRIDEGPDDDARQQDQKRGRQVLADLVDDAAAVDGEGEPEAVATAADVAEPDEEMAALDDSDSAEETVVEASVEAPSAPPDPISIEVSTDPLFTVAFSPDGSTLAAGGADRRVHLWTLDPRRAADALCTRAGAPLTEDEWRRQVDDLPYDRPCTA